MSRKIPLYDGTLALPGAPCITHIYSYIHIEKGANGGARGMGGAADALPRACRAF